MLISFIVNPWFHQFHVNHKFKLILRYIIVYHDSMIIEFMSDINFSSIENCCRTYILNKMRTI